MIELMTIHQQIKYQLSSLSNLLKDISIDQYTFKTKYLANASIGSHTRHVIELLHCVVNGYQSGVVDYINRKRNIDLEQDKQTAFDAIGVLYHIVPLNDKQLCLLSENKLLINTSFYRELVYNVEHIIHHLALIRVALVEMNIESLVDENFGFAYSTIQYKESLKTQA